MRKDQNGKSGLFIFPLACYVTAWAASGLHLAKHFVSLTGTRNGCGAEYGRRMLITGNSLCLANLALDHCIAKRFKTFRYE